MDHTEPSPAKGPLSSRDLIRARVGLRCAQLGLDPPPAPVHLKILRLGRGAVQVLASSSRMDGQALRAWLGSTRSLSLDARDVRRGQATFDVGTATGVWAALFGSEQTVDLLASPNGLVRLAVTASRDGLRELIAQLPHETGDDVQIERVPAAVPAAPVLTERQHEVIIIAFRGGYFEVPRRISLRRLARELDLSQSTLSVILRSAEERLVEAYLEGRGGQLPRDAPAPASAAPEASGPPAIGGGDARGRPAARGVGAFRPSGAREPS